MQSFEYESYGREEAEVRDNSLLMRNLDLEEQISRVEDSLKEGLKTYVEDHGIAFNAALGNQWVEFAGRKFAILTWHLRVLFDAYHHPDKVTTDPLRIYEAVVKRLVEAAENHSHIFDELLDLLSGNPDGPYEISSLPLVWRKEDSKERIDWSSNQGAATPLEQKCQEDQKPAQYLRDKAQVTVGTYPNDWANSSSVTKSDPAEWSLRLDMRRLAFACAIQARRGATGTDISRESIVGFAQRNREMFFDDPVALFFIALAFSRDIATSTNESQTILAQEYARTVIRTYPDQPGPYNTLARMISENILRTPINKQMSALQDAEKLVSFAINLDPTFWKFFQTRSMVRRRLRDFEGARQDALIALELADKPRDRDSAKANLDVINESTEAASRIDLLEVRINKKIEDAETMIMDARNTALRSESSSVQAASSAKDSNEQIEQLRRDTLIIIGFYITVIGIVFSGISLARDVGSKKVSTHILSGIVFPTTIFILILGVFFVIFLWFVNRSVKGRKLFKLGKKRNISRRDFD